MHLNVDLLMFAFLAWMSWEWDIPGFTVSFWDLKHPSLGTRGSFSIHSKRSTYSVIFNWDRTGQYRTMKIVNDLLQAIPVFAFQPCCDERQNHLQRCINAKYNYIEGDDAQV
ncbi:hypothetical protein AVEN_215748-1 [Araneus ventricosus]|uniref:Uncharacterized protein n=1 Tax=Araneus ventricosus TaxID=182803 RepID=A0A4Y2KKI9_ARAVE|nr:hypothetical protein AVEN_215748-1 [Araneus ventricosus]